MCGIWDWRSTIVKGPNSSQDPKHTLFSCKNAYIAIYILFSDIKRPLFVRLRGGGTHIGHLSACLSSAFLRGLPNDDICPQTPYKTYNNRNPLLHIAATTNQ